MLLVSLAGAVVDNLILAFTPWLWLLFVARAVAAGGMATSSAQPCVPVAGRMSVDSEDLAAPAVRKAAAGMTTAARGSDQRRWRRGGLGNSCRPTDQTIQRRSRIHNIVGESRNRNIRRNGVEPARTFSSDHVRASFEQFSRQCEKHRSGAGTVVPKRPPGQRPES